MIHLGTKIQTTFGIVDQNGNIIDQNVVTADVKIFSEQDFLAAFKLLTEYKNKLENENNSQISLNSD